MISQYLIAIRGQNTIVSSRKVVMWQDHCISALKIDVDMHHVFHGTFYDRQIYSCPFLKITKLTETNR